MLLPNHVCLIALALKSSTIQMLNLGLPLLLCSLPLTTQALQTSCLGGLQPVVPSQENLSLFKKLLRELPAWAEASLVTQHCQDRKESILVAQDLGQKRFGGFHNCWPRNLCLAIPLFRPIKKPQRKFPQGLGRNEKNPREQRTEVETRPPAL